MKTLISVTRRTEYASIVEMSRKDFDRLDKALDSDDGETRENAEAELNSLIDTNDWQDDELDTLNDFSEFKEES